MSKVAKRLAISALVAALAGYAVGILTAPKSGKETRADIKNGAAKGKAQAEKELKKLQAELTTALEDAKTKLGPAAGKTRVQIQVAVDKAKQSKVKAGEVLTAFAKGEAADEDLNYAAREAREALKHLKAYLSR